MNNQPAFPTGIITDGKGKIIGGSDGMTLRDYFAARAMQAYLNDNSLEELYVTLNKNVTQELAKKAYAMADAMMEAREA